MLEELTQTIPPIIENYKQLCSLYKVKSDMILDKRNKYNQIIIDLEEYTYAKEVLINVTTQVQKNVKTLIENFVTKGIQTIYQRNYTFKMDMKIERKKAAIDFMVVNESGLELDLKTDIGGGLMDTVALLLRLTIWIITPEKTSPIFFLDEPATPLSEKYMVRLSQLFQEFAEQFNAQIYMNTHAKIFSEIQGKRFNFTLDSEERTIVEILGED